MSVLDTAKRDLTTNGGEGSICGGHEISSILTVTSEEALRTTPWMQITKIVDDFIRNSAADEAELARKVASLEALLEAKKRDESPDTLSDDTIQGLIGDAVTEGFSSLDIAIQSKCGADSDYLATLSERPSGGYDKSSDAFLSKAEGIFDGSARATAKRIADVCFTFLQVDTSQKDGTDCDELCYEFGDLAAELSQSTAGVAGGTSSSSLEKQLQEAKRELERVKLDLDECRRSKRSLEGFEAQIKPLQKDIGVRYRTFRRARTALDEARANLRLLDGKISAQEGVRAKALELLASRGGEAGAAQKLADDAKAAEDRLRNELDLMQAKLVEATQEIAKVSSASGILNELRIAVSLTMQKMSLYIDAVVREPLRNIGLGEETNIDERFAQDAGTMPAATTVKKALDSLEGYCTNDALPAFANVKDSVDLTPLCKIGDVNGNLDGITLAVNSRRKKLADELKTAQSWLDPFKGQADMSQEQAEKYVEDGEPQYLREITSVFGGTSYYTSYLKYWKSTEANSFLKLYKTLDEALEAAKAAKQGVEEEILRLKGESVQAAEKSSSAVAACEQAVQLLHLAGEDKTAAEAVLAELREKSAALSTDLDALKKKMEEAFKAYNAALAVLKENFETGFASVEKRMLLEFESIQHPSVGSGRRAPTNKAG